MQETSLQEKLSLVGKPEWNEVECVHSQPARGDHYSTFPLTVEGQKSLVTLTSVRNGDPIYLQEISE